MPRSSQGRSLLLLACGAGLSCAASYATPIGAPPADARPLLAQASQAQKASPFAAPKDSVTAPAASAAAGAIQDLGGTRAAGSRKDSPFAGAKESDAATSAHLRVDRSRLWWLLLPLILAAAIYRALRSQEGELA